MKKYLEGAVYDRPTFEKKAEYELPKSLTEWNEEILKQFFSEVTSVPHDAGVDVVINNVDENRGYAKGSVVVFYKNKKINFPIIIKDFKLYPFDTFIADVNSKKIFMSATETNVKANLMSDEIGELKNMYDYIYGQEIKSPGNVAPKSSVSINQTAHDLTLQDQMSFRKMSSLKKASVADLEKLAVQLEAEPNVMSSFEENSGDLRNQIVDAIKEKKEIAKEKVEGILDLSGVVKAKQMSVILDSEMFDVNNMVPIQAPSVCELRMYEYPSMDDFMHSGQSAVSRLEASKVGKPINGVVLSYKNIDDGYYPKCDSPCTSEGDNGKNLRERNDQIFISADGMFYLTKSDYDKTGVLFYGVKSYNTKGLIEKVVENIGKKNINTFNSFDYKNHNDGADIVFNPIKQMNQGTGKSEYNSNVCNEYNNDIFIIYGAGDMYECSSFNRVKKTAIVEGRKIYMSTNAAVIPANVASIQKVGSVSIMTDPVYKMVLGDIKNIYLVPESSVIISKVLMSELNNEDIMYPSKPIKAMWEQKAIEKISMYVGSDGFVIKGKPADTLVKIAGKNELNAREAISALRLMGTSESRAIGILKTALDKGSVTVYGVNGDYINENAFMDKTANKRSIIKKIADALKSDTVKLASAIDDPEAVDNVLSLNFINEDNLSSYVDEIPNLKKSVTKLSEMLIASRMGLGDIDEGATKKAIDSLERVIDGLESVKMAIGK